VIASWRAITRELASDHSERSHRRGPDAVPWKVATGFLLVVDLDLKPVNSRHAGDRHPETMKMGLAPRTTRQLVKRLEALGHKVTLEPLEPAA